MSLVNHTIPGLFNGVSQQPEELRLDTQAEEQINCYGTIVGSLRKRPPTAAIFTNNTINPDSYMYSYDRGDNEKYLVFLENGKVRVFDIEGNEKSVSGGIDSYLNLPIGAKAKDSFACSTVGDTTFIVNKTAVTYMDGGAAADTTVRYSQTLQQTAFSLLSATYGYYNVSITINGVTKTHSQYFQPYFIWGGYVSMFLFGAQAAINTALSKFVGEGDYKVNKGTVSSAAPMTITMSTSFAKTSTTGGLSSNTYTITPEAIDDGSDWDETFFYWVKRTNPDVSYPANNYTYRIYLNGVLKAENKGSDAATIATALANALTAGGYTATAVGSIVKVIAPVGSKFHGADSWGDQASSSWQGVIQRQQDLPNTLGFNDAIIKIAGDEKNAFTGFFVKYTGSSYEETVKPSLNNFIHPKSMPHKLVRQGDGTFSLQVIDYSPRKVGDLDTAAAPSFIENTIQDVFFFKNRLGFISGSNVILSEVGEYFNFFPTTVTDVIDSDPIDVSVDSNQVVNLSYALPYNNNLLLFSDKAQFTMRGTEVLSPKTVSANQSTSFEFNKRAAPTNLGPNVYFSNNTGAYASIREYFVDAASVSNDAADVTAHIPTYIPANITKLTGSSGLDILFAFSEDTPTTIYVYKFYWSGDTKAQSAWSKWTFGGNIKNIEVIDTDLVMLIDRGGTLRIEKINLALTPFESIVHLDNGTIPYEAKYTLSRWRIKSQEASVDNSRGRLQIRTFSVTAEPGSTYDMIVENGPRTRVIPGVGNTDNKALIMGVTDRVLISVANSDATGKGFQINTGSFEGNYTTRSRSV